MTSCRSIALACALALPLSSALAQSASVTTAAAKMPGVRVQAGEIEVRAKVVELDSARRIATLQGPKGRLQTVDVPASVKNFDQVRVGDELVVRYAAAVAAKIEPATKSGIRERVESVAAASAPAGGLPGVANVRMIEILAVIQSLDRKAGTATLRGAKRTFTVNVPANVDIAKLKVGNEVRAVFAEATVLSVERAGQ